MSTYSTCKYPSALVILLLAWLLSMAPTPPAPVAQGDAVAPVLATVDGPADSDWGDIDNG